MTETLIRETVDAGGQVVRVAAQYSFEAAHWLPGVPEGHKCRRLHGHNYRIEVSIAGSLDRRGFVVDYAELDAAIQPIIDRLDHRTLNDIPGLENPSSEVLALWLRARIWERFPAYEPSIRIYETPRYWVEV